MFWDDAEEDDDEYDDEYEGSYFAGDCTCECDKDDHSFGTCDNLLPNGEVCHCQAGWEE